MSKGWITIQVELLSGGGITLDPPPGRVMLVGPRHTLKDLAEVIDQAFARWDISHLHEFEFPDGRVFGVPDDEFGQPIINYERVKVRSVVRPGEPFTYVFDLGDNWRHRCQLTGTDADTKEARDAAGHLPRKPVPIQGWGRIPDQYGRRWENDSGEDDTGEDDTGEDDTGEDDIDETDAGRGDGIPKEVPGPSTGLEKLQHRLREALAAEPRDQAAVARAFERLLAHPEVEEAHNIPQLLYELSQCYTAMGQYDKAIKTVKRILAGRWIGRPDGRCLIAQILLAAGRGREAEALYAAIKADDPKDIYLYEAAGTEYAAAGDHESALRWLGEGLDLAIRTGDPQGIADDLLRCRGESLAALGRSPDDLQQRAASFLAEAGEDRGWDGGRPINSTLYLKRRGRARGWCTVRVELETGGVETAGDPARDKPPGRIFLVGPEQTLENLATAIDQAFARWGRANQREFEFNGRRLGDSRVRVGSAVRTGEPFVYVPDLGGSWRLRCQIERPDVDPNDEAGIKPSIPIPIWGWGWIPDQEGTEDASRRCPHTPPGLLQDMAWPDADKAFKDVHLAIIPVGSAEQHGPHLPLGTDFVIADHLGRRAGLELGAIVTPTIPIGYAAYHTDFAGSLSVRPETLSAYLKDICECLIKYGVTHFIFVNGHGGNEGSLTSVSRWLRDQGLAAAFISWWEVVGQHDPKWALTGHADRIETSAVMAINPDAVHLERAEPPTNRPLTPRLHPLDLLNCAFEGCKVQVGLRTSDVSATGDILEHGLHWNADHATPASAATPELGRQLMDFMVGFIVDFAREFAKVEFKPARE